MKERTFFPHDKAGLLYLSSAQIETDEIELMRVADSTMFSPWRRHKTQGEPICLGFQVLPSLLEGGGGGGRRLSGSTVAESAPAARPSPLPEDAPISFPWPGGETWVAAQRR